MNRNFNQQQSSTLKPEYVLKRVNDLINSAVGNNAEKEKRFALEQLHSVIGTKRKGVWTKVYESLMKKHLELCVDLKDHHMAKDGLHQYRNLCQTVDPNSLEVVIMHLVELSESRASEARQKADKVALAAAARVADLDQEETPESIMLSCMTEDGAKDRTDREVVVPWLKFLWENYRAILELLYRIPKLEKAYHKACEKAFKFCLDYSRVMEFRRLCDTLRQQLTNMQKTPPANTRVVRAAFEWTPENIEYHLQTRFAQLEVATALELWNEGFRTVEDIYAIMVAGKKTPKAKLMVTYYEKLTRIFWVSDNKLFHAYAWYRYYCLCCDTRKDLKQEERTMLASSVLLAALTIPSTKDVWAGVEDDDVVVEKNSQMALLLDFHSNPSRQALLGDIAAKGILSEVLPELAALYTSLEAKFQPTSLVNSITAAMTAVKAHPALANYSAPLQRVVVIKVVQQLSRVYSTVRLDFVNRLLSGLSDLTPNLIEKMIVEGVSGKSLSLRINHSNGSIVFVTAQAAASAMEMQVSQLGSTLGRISTNISESLGDVAAFKLAKANARKEFLSRVLDAAEDEYVACIERKSIIEHRKEGLERQQQDKQKEERRVQEIEEAMRRKSEAERLEKEEAARNLEKKRKLMEKMELSRVQKELEKHGVVMEESAIAELDSISRRALIVEAQSESLKAKEEENRRMTEQARKLDHITRALRIEGAAAITQKYAAQLAEDRKLHDERQEARRVALKLEHDTALEEKKRLARMQGHRQAFEGEMVAKQRAVHERKLQKLRKAAAVEKRDQNIARARRLFYEDLERQEQEEEEERLRIAKEEQARLDLELAEKLRRDREQKEEVEREREAQIARMAKQIADAEAAAQSRPAEEAPKAAYKPPSSRAPAPAPATTAPSGGFDRFARGAPAPSAGPRREEGGDSWRGSRPAASEERPAAGGRWGADRERSGAAPQAGGEDKWRGSRGPSGPSRDSREPPKENTRARW